MPRRCIFVVFAIGALASWEAYSQGGNEAKFFPYTTHVSTLENGLNVVIVPMNAGGLVAYWTVVRTGSRDEYEAGHSGFAHFFEHMMFRGTENISADEYNRITTEIGADANAFTSDDLTAYHLAIAAEDLETVIRIESDRFQNLSYAEEVFKTESGAVYGEYRKSKMSPFFTIIERLREVAFTKHTYGHTVIGYEKDVIAMPTMYEYSHSFFERYYRPDNVSVVVVGDIEVETTRQLVQRYYGEWRRGYTSPKIPVEPEQTEERSFEVAYPGRSLPVLWVAYKFDGFDPGNGTLVAAQLLAHLAFGETSNIYKKLVLEEQAVQMINSSGDPDRDPGLFSVYAMIKDEGRIAYVLEEIDAVIRRYQDEPPDAGRLDDLKSRLKYNFLLSLDTPSRVASTIARFIALGGSVDAIDAQYRAYDAVTPEDIQGAAKTYLVKTRRTVGVLKGKGP